MIEKTSYCLFFAFFLLLFLLLLCFLVITCLRVLGRPITASFLVRPGSSCCRFLFTTRQTERRISESIQCLAIIKKKRRTRGTQVLQVQVLRSRRLRSRRFQVRSRCLPIQGLRRTDQLPLSQRVRRIITIWTIVYVRRGWHRFSIGVRTSLGLGLSESMVVVILVVVHSEAIVRFLDIQKKIGCKLSFRAQISMKT